MKASGIKKLKAGDTVIVHGFYGEVTCIDLTDDDKIVIKWRCAESEDVICEKSPLLFGVEVVKP